MKGKKNERERKSNQKIITQKRWLRYIVYKGGCFDWLYYARMTI